MQHTLHQLQRNWKSGLTVALVNIPLSISLAIAAGATPVMGIITAIWAGLLSAVFGGSEYNIVGPTGALSGILAAYALQRGMEFLPVLAVLSGLVMLGVYLLQWHRYIVFIPSSVTHGFTIGVAFIIGLNQLNFAFGLKGLPTHETLVGNIIESLRHIGQADGPTVLLFGAGLLLLFSIMRLSRKLPGPIIVAVLGIGLGYASEQQLIPVAFQTLLSKYGSLQMSLLQLPAFALPPLDGTLLKTVAAVSLVGVLETLLSAKIADGMTHTKFQPRKEVLGLALANIVSGVAGGLPATAALARTALNVKSGAASRWSAIVNVGFVAMLSVLLFWGFQYLPLPIVASILVYVAVRMVDVGHLRELLHIDRKMFWIAMIVAAITVAEDPIVGILVGATVALLLFVQQIAQGAGEITLHKDRKMVARMQHSRMKECPLESDVTVYRFAGELTYFNGTAHAEAIKRIDRCHTLVLSCRNLYYIDPDGLDTLKEIVDTEQERGRTVILTGIGELISAMLRKTEWYRKMEQEGLVFQSTTLALESLGFPPRHTHHSKTSRKD